MDQNGLKALVVDRFPRSTKREQLWLNFLAIVERLKALKMPCKIWIDGSFVTEKTDPDDIDFVVDFPIHVVDHASADQDAFIQKLSKRDFRHKEKLHTFVMFTVPALHLEYPTHAATHNQWKNDFGFSYVKKDPKGIAVFEVRP